jgi:hypothetical protein
MMMFTMGLGLLTFIGLVVVVVIVSVKLQGGSDHTKQ